MFAVVVGVLLVLAKVAEWGPVAAWSWWIVLAPFGVALVWWQVSDMTGVTKRREIDKLERRKQERREKALEALGLNTRRDRSVRQAREAARGRTAAAAPRDDAAAAPPASAATEPRVKQEPRL